MSKYRQITQKYNVFKQTPVAKFDQKPFYYYSELADPRYTYFSKSAIFIILIYRKRWRRELSLNI